MLFSNRRINDWVGKWLIACPAFVPIGLYRASHFAHHKEEFGPNEPDIAFYSGYPGPLGPGPFGCMLLADMGADVIRVDHPGAADPAGDVLLRGRRSVVIDLKSDDGKVFLAELIASCDVLCEGFRPGVLERLGFDPERCLQLNPRLVIARVTGWGQDGPLADTVGHDIDYAGVAGVIHAIGPTGGDPVIPLNLVADGGGGWMLTFGVMCGLWESRGSGRGQVIDVAMLDASALMMAKWFGEHAAGSWRDERGVNRIDGGSHFYQIYRTADGRHLSVGAIETKYYETFMSLAPRHDSTERRGPRVAYPTRRAHR